MVFNKNNLTLQFNKNGCILSKNFALLKSVFTLKKSRFTRESNIRKLVRHIYDPVNRVIWDKGLKLQKKLKEFPSDDPKNLQVYVIRTWLLAPIIMVSERDVIDKRVEIFEDDVYYNISTSVNDDVSVYL